MWLWHFFTQKIVAENKIGQKLLVVLGDVFHETFLNTICHTK